MPNLDKAIPIIEGSILDYDTDIIVQQVNCRGVMGGGLAAQILRKYPEVPREYKKYVNTRYQSILYSSEMLGEVLFVDTYDQRIVANVFGQDFIRTSSLDVHQYTDEPALMKGLTEVRDLAFAKGLKVAIPTNIGCGLANGKWEVIKPQIEDVFEYSGVDVTFYHYEP